MTAARPRTTAPYGAAATAVGGALPSSFPRAIGPNAWRYVREVLDQGLASDMITRFEKAFAAHLGVRHCIATPGCTPALAALAAGLPYEPGDEIVVSPVTDYGTVQGLLREHYIPVFPDTEPGTVNLSAATIEPCLTDRTRAILAVHFTGLMCDMDPIRRLAEARGIDLFEDACQAVMGRYRGRLAGTLAKAGAFSFDAEKTMGSDVGGCLVTDDDELAERVRFVGQSRGGEMVPGFGRVHTVDGYAYRMTQSTAAISLAQLEIVDQQVAVRDRRVRLLTDLLAQIPGIEPLPIPEATEVYSCWMVGFSLEAGAFDCSADDFAADLAAAGVPGAGTGRYYLMPAALPFLQERADRGVYPFCRPPASRRYRYGGDTCPTATAYLDRFVRWSTFCEKYTEGHCELAAQLVRQVADRHRT